MKALLTMFAALFLAGCATHTTVVVKCPSCVQTARCTTCAQPPTCESCAQPTVGSSEGKKAARPCGEKIQGAFGQVFRVECPGGRVTPDLNR